MKALLIPLTIIDKRSWHLRVPSEFFVKGAKVVRVRVLRVPALLASRALRTGGTQSFQPPRYPGDRVLENNSAWRAIDGVHRTRTGTLIKLDQV